MSWKRAGLGALAGAIAGILLQIAFNAAFRNLFLHPQLWPTSRSYLASQGLTGIVPGILVGTCLGILRRPRTMSEALNPAYDGYGAAFAIGVGSIGGLTAAFLVAFIVSLLYAGVLAALGNNQFLFVGTAGLLVSVFAHAVVPCLVIGALGAGATLVRIWNRTGEPPRTFPLRKPFLAGLICSFLFMGVLWLAVLQGLNLPPWLARFARP